MDKWKDGWFCFHIPTQRLRFAFFHNSQFGSYTSWMLYSHKADEIIAQCWRSAFSFLRRGQCHVQNSKECIRRIYALQRKVIQASFMLWRPSSASRDNLCSVTASPSLSARFCRPNNTDVKKKGFNEIPYCPYQFLKAIKFCSEFVFLLHTDVIWRTEIFRANKKGVFLFKQKFISTEQKILYLNMIFVNYYKNF